MIKITNGKEIFEVTRGAFDGIYSRQGFTVLEENEVDNHNEEIIGDERTDDEKFIDDVLEKPISQWNKEEVKRFANIKNIDITGTKNAGEAKELIKRFLENAEDEE